MAPLAHPTLLLNSLTTPGMVAAGLAALGAGGTFVEVAKRDIWSAARVAQERPDARHRLVAVDFAAAADVGAAMRRVAAMVAQGELMKRGRWGA